MLLGLVYSCLRLLLDIADVRFRPNDPEAEVLLRGPQLRALDLPAQDAEFMPQT